MFNTRKPYSLALQVFNTWKVRWEGAYVCCSLFAPFALFPKQPILSRRTKIPPRGGGRALGHETKTAAREATYCTGWAQDSTAKVCFASWMVQRGRVQLELEGLILNNPTPRVYCSGNVVFYIFFVFNTFRRYEVFREDPKGSCCPRTTKDAQSVEKDFNNCWRSL